MGKYILFQILDKKTPAKHPSREGFTLIELSIVLVIIALIVGGVLAGNQLIKNAEARRAVSDKDSMNAVVSTFKGKYNCMPGDCRVATSFFTASSQPYKVTNGDGDGTLTIGDNAYGQYMNSERAYFLDKLAAAGLVAMNQFDETSTNLIADGTGYIKTSIGRGMIAVTAPSGYCIVNSQNVSVLQAGKNYYILGITEGRVNGDGAIDGTFATDPIVLSNAQAYSIDSKIDDGNPYSGKVVATFSGTFGLLLGGCQAYSSTSKCVNSGNTAYNLTEAGNCPMAMMAGF